MTTFFVFVDGLGAGRRDPERNPCLHTPARLFASFDEEGTPARDDEVPLGGIYVPLDATLGVEGTPQSATGQTALFTGVNAAKLLGFHLWAMPNRQLREVLARDSIHRQLVERGRVTRFVNAFRPPPEPLPEDLWTDPRYVRLISASVWANRAAGNPVLSVPELLDDRAISFDLTGQAFRDRGFDVPLRTPARAGEVLARAGRGLDLAMFEYFQTDRAGHREQLPGCAKVLADLEEFVLGLLHAIDPSRDTVLLTSDHGNIEDAPSRGHTLSPAQTYLWGRGSQRIAARLRDLTDVTPALVEAMGEGP